MILMPQIFDVTANENARYKRNELEWKNDQLLSKGEPTYRPLKMPISDALFNILKGVFEKLSD